MTQNRVRVIARILVVNLFCDEYTRDNDGFFARWSDENRPSDEELDALGDKVFGWGGSIVGRSINGGYDITIQNDATK